MFSKKQHILLQQRKKMKVLPLFYIQQNDCKLGVKKVKQKQDSKISH